ncbi:mitochondrial carrier domain-containing protein [Schizophyllum amplum]|uniref:Mitochondrial carrier domain-containing protein n=1 Tax=Schizophyllum amplum TaxID=97359 RepID=A0A550BY98_9AGAR|nr:mitochondrial carrier domain-containing protein [Auriculariopsis ampla]
MVPNALGVAEPEEPPLFSAREACRDIVLGSIAGMVSELFEYPFDLAKTRLQAQLLSPTAEMMPFTGPMDCLKQTYLEEGARGLYRGLTVPLVGAMAETSALFLSYTYIQYTIRQLSSNHSAPLSIAELSAAAAGSGFLASFIITPLELVKCRMQVQLMNSHSKSRTQSPISQSSSKSLRSPISSTSANNTSRPSSIFSANTAVQAAQSRNISSTLSHLPGPWQIINATVRTSGFQGLWVGHVGTMLRETGGTAIWFAIKEWAGRLMIERRLVRNGTYGNEVARRTTPLLPWESAVAGAAGGAACAFALYPVDTVKSAMQTEVDMGYLQGKVDGNRARAKTSFLGALRNMYRSHGLRGLYAGCGMTVAQAIPTSGIVFVVYDGLAGYFA